MEYVELSIEKVKEKSNELYSKIIYDYNYDLVIFIAKGSYLIGEELASLNNADLLEIFATREGGKIKKIIKPLLKLIPKNFLIKLREKEMKSDFHEQRSDRKVSFDVNIYSKYRSKKNILLVDDSIDSGNSVKIARERIKDFFPDSNIKVAVFNVMKKSTLKPDYTLYEDTMICGPWSADSKDNKKHITNYNKWHYNYIKGEK